MNIGKNAVISDDQIVGLFDLDSSSQSYLTREYLSEAEKAGSVINAADDIPNSFLIVSDKGKQNIYLTQSMSKTLAKKIEQLQEERRDTWPNSTN